MRTMSSPYANWIVFLLVHSLLTLNLLAVKHYLLDTGARPLDLAGLFYDTAVRASDAYQLAKESIDRILDQICLSLIHI